jgi:hypothetical protein
VGAADGGMEGGVKRVTVDLLKHYARQIESLRVDIMCEEDAPESRFNGENEQLICMALDALSTARSYLKIVAIRQEETK